MKYTCAQCGKEVEGRHRVRKVGGEWLCTTCNRERRLAKRKQQIEELKEQGIMRKRRTPEKIKKDRKEQKEESNNLKIKGAKEPKKLKNPKLSFYLTKVERQVLFRKYIKEGCDGDEAKIKVNNISNNMVELVKELMNEKKSKQEIDNKFKEELAKLLQ